MPTGSTQKGGSGYCPRPSILVRSILPIPDTFDCGLRSTRVTEECHLYSSTPLLAALHLLLYGTAHTCGSSMATAASCCSHHTYHSGTAELLRYNITKYRPVRPVYYLPLEMLTTAASATRSTPGLHGYDNVPTIVTREPCERQVKCNELYNTRHRILAL